MKTAHLTLVLLGALTLSGAALACGEDAEGDASSATMARAGQPAKAAAARPDPREAGRRATPAEDGARVARAHEGPSGGRARTAARRGA